MHEIMIALVQGFQNNVTIKIKGHPHPNPPPLRGKAVRIDHLLQWFLRIALLVMKHSCSIIFL